MHDGKSFAAFLFDMDGTILSSIGVAERIWGEWASRNGLNPEEFLPTIHGVKAVETIRRLDLPGVDAEAEAEQITREEIANVEGIEAIAGVDTFLGSIPQDRWAVMTSAPRVLAERRIEAARLPMPGVLVAAEDVGRGKPAPDGYVQAAARLGVPIEDCLVFEDALAGIKAAEAAGASIVHVTGFLVRPFSTPHPSINDFRKLRVNTNRGGRHPLSIARSA